MERYIKIFTEKEWKIIHITDPNGYKSIAMSKEEFNKYIQKSEEKYSVNYNWDDGYINLN